MLKSNHFIKSLFLIVFLLFTGFSSPQVRRDVIKTYTAEIGVKEKTGNNDGVEVETYLRYVKLSKGNPWCAAFVCWVMGKNKVVNPRSGWSPSMFPKSKIVYQRNSKGRQTDPLPGSVFGLYFPNKGRIAHVGYIDEWPDGSIWCITVEGNTNEAGSREGDGVYKKKRLKSSIYIVSDFIN